MRLRTIPRPPGTLPIGALLMSFLFALPLGAWLIQEEIIDLGTCGLQAAFGLPCLSCGSTRATLQLLDGQLLTALALQPLMISIYFLLTAWGLASFGTFLLDKKMVLDLSRREDLAFKVAILSLPFLNWVYLIWIGV